MKSLSIISSILLTGLLLSCSGKYAVSPAEFSKNMEKTEDKIILDVRTPEEFSAGHIKNAINVDWNGDDFDGGVSKLDKSKTVFVYCHSGRRSAAASSELKSLGFNKIQDLDGGMAAWSSANYAVTTE